MKKYLVLTLMAISAAAFAEGKTHVYGKIGFDAYNRYEEANLRIPKYENTISKHMREPGWDRQGTIVKEKQPANNGNGQQQPRPEYEVIGRGNVGLAPAIYFPELSGAQLFDSKGSAKSFTLEFTRDYNEHLEFGLGLSYIMRGSDSGKSAYIGMNPNVERPQKVSTPDGPQYVGTSKLIDGSKPIDFGTIECNDVRYDSLPLYLTAKYNFDTIGNWKPYIKGDFGYSFNKAKNNFEVRVNPNGEAIRQVIDFDSPVPLPTGTLGFEMSTEVTNGMYYGVGIGAEYNNFLVELSYHVTKADLRVTGLSELSVGGLGIDTASLTSIDGSYDNKAVTLSVGYKFDF